jgi:hypothetical protein
MRVSAEGGGGDGNVLPGVENVRDLGQFRRSGMARGADPQEALRKADRPAHQ